MQKPKIIINNKNIKIVKGATIRTFDNTAENIDLIKEHLALTPMTKLGAAYIVNGGPIAQTIEVLKTRQPMFCDGCIYLSPTESEQSNLKESHICNFYNKKVAHGNHHPKILRLDTCSAYTTFSPNSPPEYLEALEDLTAKTESEFSDTGKAKPPKKSKKVD